MKETNSNTNSNIMKIQFAVYEIQNDSFLTSFSSTGASSESIEHLSEWDRFDNFNQALEYLSDEVTHNPHKAFTILTIYTK